jgi:hypothetical protein
MNRPRLNLGSFRGWHLWLSIALSLPILVVALTAIFIAHDKSLALKDVQVYAGWLPGMRGGKAEAAEARAIWAAPGGVTWLGTKAGLYRVRGELAAAVEGLARADVRALHAVDSGLLVATTRGLYHVAPDGGPAERVATGDFWWVGGSSTGLAAAGKGSLLRSIDGRHWQHDEQGGAALKQVALSRGGELDSGRVPLSRLVMDLHTGKALFGKDREWIWIDLIGATMALLTLTGLVMWWRGQRRKLSALEAQLAAALQPAGDGGAPALRSPSEQT